MQMVSSPNQLVHQRSLSSSLMLACNLSPSTVHNREGPILAPTSMPVGFCKQACMAGSQTQQCIHAHQKLLIHWKTPYSIHEQTSMYTNGNIPSTARNSKSTAAAPDLVCTSCTRLREVSSSCVHPQHQHHHYGHYSLILLQKAFKDNKSSTHLQGGVLATHVTLLNWEFARVELWLNV